jgi:hypothetical protein
MTNLPLILCNLIDEIALLHVKVALPQNEPLLNFINLNMKMKDLIWLLPMPSTGEIYNEGDNFEKRNARILKIIFQKFDFQKICHYPICKAG